MSLPPNVQGTFSYVYHFEIDELASWLKTRATALGFTSNLPQKTYVADLPSPTAFTIVPTPDYTAMATLIAKDGAVPPEVLKKLDRAINIREIWAQELKPRLEDNAERKRADQIHMSFLGVLKKVRKILTPHPKVDVQAKKRKKTTAEERTHEPVEQPTTEQEEAPEDHAMAEVVTEDKAHEPVETPAAEQEQTPEDHAAMETAEEPSGSSESNSGFAPIFPRSWSAPTSLSAWEDNPWEMIGRRRSAAGEIKYRSPWNYNYAFDANGYPLMATISEEDQVPQEEDVASSTIEKPSSTAEDQTPLEGDTVPDTVDRPSPVFTSTQDQMHSKDNDVSDTSDKLSSAAASEHDQIPQNDNNVSDTINTVTANTTDSASVAVASAQDQMPLEDDDWSKTTDTAKEPLSATTSPQYEASNTFDNASSTSSSSPPKRMLASGSTLRPSTPPTEPPPTYVAEPMPNMAEDYTAIYVLLSDLQDLRAQVTRAWKAFKDGDVLTSVHLVTASLVTNAAVDLAHGLEQDCRKYLMRQGGLEHVLHTLLEGECKLRGTDIMAREIPGDLFNYKTFDYVEKIFLMPFSVLGWLAANLESGRNPGMTPDTLRLIDPKSVRSTKPARERCKEDCIYLEQIFPEAVTLVNGSNHCPLEDEFTRSIRLLARTTQPKLNARMLWMAFAAQLYIDIRNIMREDIERGWEQLLSYSKLTLRSILNSSKIYEASKPGLFPSDFSCMEEARKLQDMICSRILMDPQRKAAKISNRNTIPSPFYYNRLHPWACGLYYYHIKQHLHILGISLANTSGSIMYCGHLYHAGREEGFNFNWDDMDLVLRLRNPEMSRYPKHLNDYLRGFMMTMGETASPTALNTDFASTMPAGEHADIDLLMAFVHQSRQSSRPSAVLSRPPRQMQYMAPTHETFRKRYDENGCAVIYEGDVQTILENYHPEGWKIMFDTIPVTDLLPALQTACQREQVEFNIDYLALHETCWTLLRTLRKECADEFEDLFGPEYMNPNEENQLPLLIGYIVNAAVNERKGPFLRGQRLKNGRSTALPLKALSLIQRLVEGEMYFQEEKLVDVVRSMDFESWLVAPRPWALQMKPML